MSIVKGVFGKAPRTDSLLNPAGDLPDSFQREVNLSTNYVKWTKRLRAEKCSFS